jgi:hypothetical protein
MQRAVMTATMLFVTLAMVNMAVSQTPAPPPAAAPAPTIVLDTAGFWRMYHTLKPPVVQSDDGLQPQLFNRAWLDTPSPPPPAGWTAPDFDDSGWIRFVGLRFSKTPYLANLCLRGKFHVTDVDQVRGLRLTLGYYGGAIVTVNGTEVARGHVAPGAGGTDALATPYPEEVYVTPQGELITKQWNLTDEARRRIAARERVLADVAIPSKVLRKGVNVLAIEILRAPYDKLHLTKLVQDRGGQGHVGPQWNSCELRRVQLVADTADGLVPNASRPAGWQVWNSDVMMSDFDLDYGDPAEPLRPVKILGPRGGAFSGKFVLGDTEPIRGLKVTVGDLSSGDAKIAASAVRVRYATPWGHETLAIPYIDEIVPYPRSPGLLSALAEKAPAEVPVMEAPKPDGRTLARWTASPVPVPGAVAPVWLTVSIPADAKPGVYRGTVRAEADGRSAVTVPVEVTVVDWTLPAPQDYRTWVELVEVPDTLSLEYGLTPYSEKHWEMIAHAFDLLGEAGSRTVHVPLICETNLGHEQSMVRWIKKADGTYDYDFTLLDRYLDTAAMHMGRPRMVVFWVWDIYLTEQEKYHGKDHLILEQAIAAREAMRGTGPKVTALDPATGKTEMIALPQYKTPEGKKLWAPLMAKIMERMKARGLADVMHLGMLNDVTPSKAEYDLFAEICPGVPWALHAHGGPKFGTLPGTTATLAYKAQVWGVQLSDTRSLRGWSQPNLFTYYDRERQLNGLTPATWLAMAETAVTGSLRGIGRLGGDYWPPLKNKRGLREGYAWTRYPQSSWRNLDLWSYCLAPGPDGPVAGTNFEYLREGIEHSEARIYLESVLARTADREKLGEELATRCQTVLDQRQAAMVRSVAKLQMYEWKNSELTSWGGGVEVAGYTWFLGSGWQERSRMLFELCGEVSRKLGETR